MKKVLVMFLGIIIWSMCFHLSTVGAATMTDREGTSTSQLDETPDADDDTPLVQLVAIMLISGGICTGILIKNGKQGRVI